MSYTIKQVSQLSGISIRALRFYDEIDVLKPAYYGENGYRYYEQEQLFLLQQILLYREMGFSLSAIKHVLNNTSENQIAALLSHKKTLQQKLTRINNLLITLDKTIATLRGEIKMTHEEMYDGFDPIDLPKYDEIAIQELGPRTQEILDRRNKITQNWGKAEWDKLHFDWNELVIEFASALEKKLNPTSTEVHKITERQYQHIKKLYSPSKAEYLDLAKINCNHPEYKKQFDFYHENLAGYIEQAMQEFAKSL